MKKLKQVKFTIVDPQTVSDVANMCARNTFSLFCDIKHVEKLTKSNHRKVMVCLFTLAALTGFRAAKVDDQIIEINRKLNALREKVEESECDA